MLDLGAASDVQRAEAADPHADDPAVVLVNTLLTGSGASGSGDGPVDRVAAEIHRRVRAGETPVGLNRLSEVFAPAVAVPPAPRQPIEDPDAVVEVVRCYPCAVVDAPDALSVARCCLAAVLIDGRVRVVVTGADAAALDAVRAALPEPLRGLCLDGELPLTEAEIPRAAPVDGHRDRRAAGPLRSGVLPDLPGWCPRWSGWRSCAARPGRKGQYPVRDGADVISELLGGLEAERLDELIVIANRYLEALAQVGCAWDSPAVMTSAAYQDGPWAWLLLPARCCSVARGPVSRSYCAVPVTWWPRRTS